MQHSPLPKNALYIAAIDGHPARMSCRGSLIPEDRTPHALSDEDLSIVLEDIEDGYYEHRVISLHCINMDTGDAIKMDWQRELDAWRDDHMSVDDKRALAPAGYGR